MQTIGEKLQEARTRQGITLREAAESTKVRSDFLEAMENNHFESIALADVYKRGFLKIYAKFLRLDTERIASEFNDFSRQRQLAPARRLQRENFGRLEVISGTPEKAGASPGATEDPREIEFSPSSLEVAPHSEIDWKKLIVIVAGSCTAIILLFFLVTFLGKCSSPSGTGTPAAPTAQNPAGDTTTPPPVPNLNTDATTPPEPTNLQYIVKLSVDTQTSVKIYQDGNPTNVFFEGRMTPQRNRDITVYGDVIISADKPFAVKAVVAGKNYWLNQDDPAYANATGFRIRDPKKPAQR